MALVYGVLDTESGKLFIQSATGVTEVGTVDDLEERLATTQQNAEDADEARDGAEAAESAAEGHAAAAQALNRYYSTKAAGAAALATGQMFTSDEDGALAIYKRTGSAPNYELVDLIATLGNVRREQGASGIHPHPREGTLCLIGDSNTVKGSYFGGAETVLWGAGGYYENWLVYNSASNGSYARDWKNSIAAGSQVAAPLDGDDATRNLWRLVNSKPRHVAVCLGTNDARQLGGGYLYADVAALRVGLEADLKAIAEFLLRYTNAELLEFQMPIPLTYIAGSVSGFCNFVDANDAFARNQAVRDCYLALEGHSSRISVMDTHRIFFPAGTAPTALRWDSLAASTDPETGTVIKVDELHYTPFGETRRAHAMARRRVPSKRHNPKVQVPPVALFQGGAHLAARGYIKGVGAGYIDIYSNLMYWLFGAMGSSGTGTTHDLANVPRAEDFWLQGGSALLWNVLQATTLSFVDRLGTAASYTPTSVTHTVVDSINDYYRVSFSGGAVPGLVVGLADVYVTTKDRLPRMPALTQALTLNLRGADSTPSARVVVPITNQDGLQWNGLPDLSANTVQATRQAGTDIATFDLYMSNVWNGSMDATNATYDAAAPGLKMGTVDLPANYLMQSGWTPTALGTALSGRVPAHGYPNVSIYAVKTAGTIGDWATISIKAR